VYTHIYRSKTGDLRQKIATAKNIGCGEITYIGTFSFRGTLPFRYFWRRLP
jgi:hypothetical protein